MISLFDWFLNKAENYRKIIGIAFFFFGAPMIYFLRDFVGIASGSTAFTGLVMILSIALIFPYNYNRLFKPNIIATNLYLSFAFLWLFYLLAYSPNSGWFTRTEIELVYLFIVFIILYIFMSIRLEEIEDKLLEAILIICFISAIGLLYYLISNPAYFLGKTRAAIGVTADDGTTTSSGNPHLFAKTGYAGVVVAIVLMRKYTSILAKLILGGFTFLFITVLALTQSMSTNIALFLFFLAYSFFNTSFASLLKFLMNWKVYAFIILMLFLYFGFYKGSNFENYIDYFSDILFNRVERVYNALFTDTKGLKATEIDASAYGRFDTVGSSIETTANHLKEGNYLKLLFGNGYQSVYIDFPPMQAYHDMGILGALAFVFLHIYIFILVISEMRRPTSIVKTYFAYLVILIYVNQLTGGMPYDFNRYSILAFIVRFFIPYKVTQINPSTSLA